MIDSPLVLVVDDQPHVRLPLEYLIKSLPGTRVLTASNGQQAVELAIQHRPLLVLMDVMMPVLDGYAAAQQIRAAWGDYRGQIWFLTARGSNLDSEQAQAVGAGQFITKPFDPDRVVAQVRDFLASCQPPGVAPAAAA